MRWVTSFRSMLSLTDSQSYAVTVDTAFTGKLSLCYEIRSVLTTLDNVGTSLSVRAGQTVYCLTASELIAVSCLHTVLLSCS